MIMPPKFEIYKDANEKYRFRLRASNNEIILSSSDAFSTIEKCKNIIESIKSDTSTVETADETISRLKSSYVWYLVPLLLAFVGSIIGYLALKDRNKEMAKKIVAIGIIIGFVWFGLFFSLPKSDIKQPHIVTTVTTQTSTITTTISPTTTQSTTQTSRMVTSTTELPNVKVKEVIDGDSIVLDDNSEIRLLGINAPEKGYPFEEEAKDRLSSLILGKEVRLESDFEDEDRYGRLLRYVFVDGMLVNAQLVKEGLANVYMESGLKHEDELHEAEYYAKLNALGIWEKDVAYADYIYIVKFHYDAAGNDHENLNDEYVVLGNKGDIPIDMTEWTIKDEVNHIFTFPNFVLGPGEEVAIHTGSGVNTEDSLFWNNQGAVWNNKGDSLYLRNSAGELIFSYEY